MNIKNKQELDEIIQYERDIYIEKLYPNPLNKNIKNKHGKSICKCRRMHKLRTKSNY